MLPSAPAADQLAVYPPSLPPALSLEEIDGDRSDGTELGGDRAGGVHEMAADLARSAGNRGDTSRMSTSAQDTHPGPNPNPNPNPNPRPVSLSTWVVAAAVMRTECRNA